MRSEATDVDAYLAEAPEDRRQPLTRLRALCRAELIGYEEAMAYGMPTYARDGGETEIAFGSQKQYISIHLMRRDVREAFEERLAAQDMDKGCLRFRKPDTIDFDLLRDLLRATAKGPGTFC